MLKTLYGFAADESGATAIEYSVIAAGLGVMVVVGARAAGSSTDALFMTIADTLLSDNNAPPPAATSGPPPPAFSDPGGPPPPTPSGPGMP